MSIQDQGQPTSKGGLFFVIDRTKWGGVCRAAARNRLYLMLAYLCICCGTGKSNTLSSWSADAIERHIGIGNPRARRAIEELIQAGLIHRTRGGNSPRYSVTAPDGEVDPIFLPNQLVTGCASEPSALYRVRETRSAAVLELLVWLYGSVQTDAAFGICRSNLGSEARLATPIKTIGVHTVWTIGAAAWNPSFEASHHVLPECLIGGSNIEQREQLASAVATLFALGLLVEEEWLFDGPDPDAEPIYPTASLADHGPAAELSRLAEVVARMYARQEVDALPLDRFCVLPSHRAAPAVGVVVRLRVEADTPARRRGFAARLEAIERWMEAYGRHAESLTRDYGRPVTPLQISSARA